MTLRKLAAMTTRLGFRLKPTTALETAATATLLTPTCISVALTGKSSFLAKRDIRNQKKKNEEYDEEYRIYDSIKASPSAHILKISDLTIRFREAL